VHLRLVRHSTLILEAGGLRLLVDPQLDPAGARDAVPGTPNPRRSPLVELPEPAEVVARDVDAVFVTHLHQDHFDATARRLLARDVPLLCQPPEAERLRADGFTDVRPVADEAVLGTLRIARTGGRHGTGAVGDRMAPVSGFVLASEGEPTLYIAGDTLICDELRDALARHRPDVIVLNGGAAQFLEGGPITMPASEIVEVARMAPDAHIVAIHFETVSHCVETRADLHQRLHDEGLTDRVTVPEDGSEVPLEV
jgi:L-ascorbate metabolism protein UlaG (beta-lactamase superfamily)